MTAQQPAPHENETTHDADAVTRPERSPEEGRFDIGEGVSGVAETETSTDPTTKVESSNPEFDDVRRSVDGTGEDHGA